MGHFRLDHVLPADTAIPDPVLIVLIGAAGSGKSTWARTWPFTQVLELDRFRAMVSDAAGDQSATPAAVTAMHAVLEGRLARRRTTVIDATNTESRVRAGLVRMARDHGVPTVALVVPTPVSVCVERQAYRRPDRAVPEDVVRRQHADMTAALPGLRQEEGFDHVLIATTGAHTEATPDGYGYVFEQRARIAEMATRPDQLTEEDARWLLDRAAWADWHLEELRDRIDTAGSLMNTSEVCRAIDYTRWSRATPEGPVIANASRADTPAVVRR
ncbi:ATP-binding protein [Streptomyces sp. SID8373]|uniref:ATP-binding protein n=1 Tax=Streptomyces sp. SID8373 TaxID=2690353 RepID=UPI0004AF4751|nr:ATP-binding protein [Streptomyces sp. SID8373]MYX68453.1 AAA family ATPase [Streptomyces sp. SID8373]